MKNQSQVGKMELFTNMAVVSYLVCFIRYGIICQLSSLTS